MGKVVDAVLVVLLAFGVVGVPVARAQTASHRFAIDGGVVLYDLVPIETLGEQAGWQMGGRGYLGRYVYAFGEVFGYFEHAGAGGGRPVLPWCRPDRRDRDFCCVVAFWCRWDCRLWCGRGIRRRLGGDRQLGLHTDAHVLGGSIGVEVWCVLGAIGAMGPCRVPRRKQEPGRLRNREAGGVCDGMCGASGVAVAVVAGSFRGRVCASSAAPRQCCAAGTHAVVRPPMVRCSDTLAAGRARVGPPAPAAVEEPRARVARIVGVGVDRALDDGGESGAQAPGFGIRQRGGAAPGIDAGLIEHLVRDPVADPGRERLVEQQRLHVGAACADQLGEPLRRGHRQQGVETKLCDGGARARGRRAAGCGPAGARRSWRARRRSRSASGSSRTAAATPPGPPSAPT